MFAKLKDRFVILSIFFVVFGIAMVLQLANLQIIHGEENYEKSQNKQLSDRNIAAPRGSILDRYGVPLATSRQGYAVQIVRTNLKTAQLNEMLLNLTKVLESHGDGYTRGLAKYLNLDDGKVVFGTALDKMESDEEKIAKIKKDVGIKDKDFAPATVEEVFQYFKGKLMFSIDEKYSVEDAYRIMTLRFDLLIKGFTMPKRPSILIASDVSRETVAELEERHDDFSGVTIDNTYFRNYADAQLASHVVGYVRGIDIDTYNAKASQGYRMDDLIGKAGVELAAESYLKGKSGLKNIEVDRVGRVTKEISDNPPVPGNDVVLTIDTKLQKVALDSLEKNIALIRSKADGKKNFGDAVAGAAVAIDVNNGEVLAMASYPSYDPGIFLESAENRQAQQLITQWINDKKNRPMANRTIQDIYAPGSTFKPLVGIAGLEEGAITKYSTINDTGRVNIGNKDFVCMEYRDYGYNHGRIALAKALETSCNIFFHILGDSLGIDKLDKWAKNFGLGEKTGLDIDSGVEAKGIRANKAFKIEWAESINKWAATRAQNEGRKFGDDEKESPLWFPADTAQAAIGQSFNTYTPLQIANYIATLANGGMKFKPHVIKKVVKYDGSIVTETKPEFEQVGVKPETIQAVKEGMLAVSEGVEGTAQGLFDNLTYEGAKVRVAGKTGTAETGLESASSSNALFVCYAPADNPKIAVAVVIEKGVWGANAAPVAKDILEEYFKQNSSGGLDDTVKPEAVVFTR